MVLTAAVLLLWLASLLLVGWVTAHRAEPKLAATQAELKSAQSKLAQQADQLEQLHHQQANLSVSDQISRAANNELQTSLAERDEQIAGLRADVAFYERLVGSTRQRHGLTVHSVEFSPEQEGSWRYTVVLTQNLDRDAVSKGQLRFSIEGMRNGKRNQLDWTDLHQQTGAAGQDYSFRYFQQLNGSVILPEGFIPQRVKVSLTTGGQPVEQSFDFKQASKPAPDA